MKKSGRKSTNIEEVKDGADTRSRPTNFVSTLSRAEWDSKVLNAARKRPIRVSLGDVITGKNPNVEREKKLKERLKDNELLNFSKRVEKGIKNNKPLPYNPHKATESYKKIGDR